MSDEIINAARAKTGHIRKFLELDADGVALLDDYESRLIEFAAGFDDAAEFETAFAADALGKEYFSFYQKFQPKPYKMTDEDRKTVHDTAVKMMEDDRGDIIRGIAEDIVSEGMTHLKGRYITGRRNEMIEDGTFDEYTRLSNEIDDAGRMTRSLGKRFAKK